MRANALLSRDSAALFLLEGDGSLRAVVAVGAQAVELQDFRVPAGRFRGQDLPIGANDGHRRRLLG